MNSLSKLCFATTEGVSLLGINDAANTLYLFHVCWVIVLLQRYAFSYYNRLSSCVFAFFPLLLYH